MSILSSIVAFSFRCVHSFACKRIAGKRRDDHYARRECESDGVGSTSFSARGVGECGLQASRLHAPKPRVPVPRREAEVV